jgi:membrane protease YdiL (CAAX protease family)
MAAGLLRVLRLAPVRLAVLTWGLFYLYLSGHLFRAQFAQGAVQDLAVVLWMAAVTLALYVGFVRLVEGRAAREVAPARMGRELGLGLVMGSGTYAACVLVLWVLGAWRFEGLGDWRPLAAQLWFAVSSGFFEELFFRGVLFRIAAELVGSWGGIVVSALAFGLVHLNNEGATYQGVMFIAVETGLLLAAAYMLTGRLWLGMGWHMAWNWTQGAVFSGAGSGGEVPTGLVHAVIEGPALLTGGAFGMEASLPALVLGTGTGVVLAAMAARRGRVEKPMWLRR